jgi:predicted permease
MLILLGLQFAAKNNGVMKATSSADQSNTPLHLRYQPLGIACLTRLVIAPLIGVGVALVLNMKGAAMQAAITESAAPAAVMITALATEYEIDPSFATSMVLISTILSPLTVTPILAWLGG